MVARPGGLQYHEAGLKPMGVVVDGATGLFAVIKKSGRSFVRPVDPLEQLVLKRGVGVNGPELLSDTPRLGEDPALANDVVNLVRAISIVGKNHYNYTTVFFSTQKLFKPSAKMVRKF